MQPILILLVLLVFVISSAFEFTTAHTTALGESKFTISEEVLIIQRDLESGIVKVVKRRK